VSDKPNDKRITWLIGATLFNTVISLAAIGLWFFAPNRGRDQSGAAAKIDASTAAPAVARPPIPPLGPVPRHLPGHPSGQSSPFPPPLDVQAGALPPARLDARGLDKTGNVKIAPSTQALAERLNLEPQTLALTFADESGEIPKNTANRLEHAFDSASSLAKRRNLDESKKQSLVAILTYHEFSVLREEKAAAPGPVDPTRLEEIRNETLTGIRTTCGDEMGKDAEAEMDQR
jgi:hypothetical protein